MFASLNSVLLINSFFYDSAIYLTVPSMCEAEEEGDSVLADPTL